MAGSLALSPTANPFPWAAVAIATFTGKAELTFDTTAKGLALNLDGSNVSEEDEIVRTLAKAGGLADESVKVCFPLFFVRYHLSIEAHFFVRRKPTLTLPNLSQPKRHFLISSPFSIPWTTILLSEHI